MAHNGTLAAISPFWLVLTIVETYAQLSAEHPNDPDEHVRSQSQRARFVNLQCIFIVTGRVPKHSVQSLGPALSHVSE